MLVYSIYMNGQLQMVAWH